LATLNSGKILLCNFSEVRTGGEANRKKIEKIFLQKETDFFLIEKVFSPNLSLSIGGL
jgi:hypothetical protein